MRREYIKHEHLRAILNEMQPDDYKKFEENLEDFLSEITHSSLIMAGNFESGDISVFHIDGDEDEYAMLFTDMDEFRKVFPAGEVEATDHLFATYKMMLPKLNLDGFILNLKSEAFIFPNEMFDLIEDMPLHKLSSDNPYGSRELKMLKDSINNESMEAFIRDPKNIGKYEELFEEMSKSTMLTLMLSDNDLSDIAHDGIIETIENGPVGFLYLEELGGTYATMYTSEAKMADVDTPLNKYSQVVNPALITSFILNDDMDGLIINPHSDNILLTRDVLIEYSSLIQRTCNDPKLNKGIFHMFVIEEEV